ncbi:PREDICTED: BTB/POZ domain-containing protein DOT3 [Ipomoea nil]|uniref:BTB/POZ domain-containing protein DOT3 n=1 Tax=Ipomoea nil TaxID=35883 RepID=UPI000900A437|nr:PREDICTED: BTB/POZ domain-containing protein DOT3 [Ipomoea nil]
MKKCIKLERSESFGSDSDDAGGPPIQTILFPPKFITTADSFERREQSWYANCQIPTDLSIQVQDVTFHVHKFPLVSKCGYLSRVEFQPPNPNSGYDHKIEKFPGGADTFEIILKFCYGLQICLNPNNVAALRCASEFLEMNESQEDGNLISKAEAFFTFVALSSWKDTITVLKSCELLSPWAENLQIVRRCCDSIAWKICQESSTDDETMNQVEESWWFEDLSVLRIDHFSRIIAAVRAKGMKGETIGSCIMFYGEKWLSSLENEMEGKGKHGRNELQWNITIGVRQERGIGQNNKEQRIIIESLVSALPPQKEAVSCKFLLRMLKLAILHSVSPALVSELEKRVGMVLENANVHDLLIPSHFITDQGNPINESEDQTMHNIDVVQRILEYFLMYEHQRLQQEQQKTSTLNISKLVDNYLAEVARDPNLSITRFQVLAEFLPRNLRTCDDGLYRAIDIYLKSHPSLSEHDRRRLCKVIECEKLSLDACMHAAQNDRLPLRIVIQILFAEQVKMRAIMQQKGQTSSDDNSEKGGSSWSSTKKEVKCVKEELDKLKEQMGELQRDYSELQKEYEKVNKHGKNFAIWAIGWKKIKRATLFNGKLEVEESDEGQNRINLGRRANPRRRQSVS